ncbi:MAG: hypothetical protein AAF824_00785 [Bacteroidota bacterium]
MKRLAIALCILSVLAATCNGEKNAFLKQQKAASYFITESKKDSILWKLIQIYDPYSGKIKLPEEEMKYLSIQKGGKYILHSLGGKQEGQWYLKKDKSAIALIAKENVSNQADILFRHQIRKFSKDTMILAWQGRHGYVEELYVKAESIYYPTPKALP